MWVNKANYEYLVAFQRLTSPVAQVSRYRVQSGNMPISRCNRSQNLCGKLQWRQSCLSHLRSTMWQQIQWNKEANFRSLWPECVRNCVLQISWNIIMFRLHLRSKLWSNFPSCKLKNVLLMNQRTLEGSCTQKWHTCKPRRSYSISPRQRSVKIYRNFFLL